MSALSELPPPRKGAKAGYYPDPLGGPHARWWDGGAWNLRLGPRVPADAPRNRALTPPTKTCRHCGAEAKTFQGTCPHCGKPYGQRSGLVIAAIAGACLAFVLFLGGCAVLFAAIVGTIDDRYAITQREFDSIPLGSTVASVESRLGQPLQSKHLQEEPHGRVLCLTYNKKGGGAFNFDTFELCFANGGLYSKRGPGGDTVTASFPP